MFENEEPSKMSKIEYEGRLYGLQVELLKWQQHVKETGEQHIVLFEGRDGAGKSGAVKRFMEHINPRSARVVALDKPTEQEGQEWYWQRYVRQFPKAGEITFWDRSWYNRAGVEPVMGFCSSEERNHFLWEAPILEAIWKKGGIRIVKFWFSVSRLEQARRFTEREVNPLKLGKLSVIDANSQRLWDAYSKAKRICFKATNKRSCPWVTIKSDDKRKARVAAMQYVLLVNEYVGKDLANIGDIDSLVLRCE